MKKKMNASTLSILFLSIAFLVMSVGFAAYAQKLDINGTATAKKASWDIRFVDDSYTETTGSVAATSKTLTATTMTYAVTLKPGEFYEFTVNVKNAGTFDAILKSLTMSDLTDAQKKFITYKVTYDTSEYTATTTSLSSELASEATKPVKVRVEYVLPTDAKDLPTEDVTLNLTASLDYVQKA